MAGQTTHQNRKMRVHQVDSTYAKSPTPPAGKVREHNKNITCKILGAPEPNSLDSLD